MSWPPPGLLPDPPPNPNPAALVQPRPFLAVVRNLSNYFGEAPSKSFAKLTCGADGTYSLPQAKFNAAGQPTAAYQSHLSGRASDYPMDFVDTLDANGNKLQPPVKAYLDLRQQLWRSAFTETSADIAKWGAPPPPQSMRRRHHSP